MSDTFDITKPRPLYNNWAGYWQMFRDFYEFGPDVLYSGEYLHKHPRETQADFNNRVKRCDNYNLIPDIIGVYKSYQFANSPERDFKGTHGKILEGFVSNADGKGGSMDDFMQDTAYVDTLNFGWTELFVDMPKIVSEIYTEQQQIEAGAVPYVRSIVPLDRINWSLDTDESYKWTIIKERPGESDVLTNTPVENPTYLLLKRDGWERYEKNEDDEGEYALVDAGIYNFNRVPLIPMYYQKSRKHRRFGISLCNEIAPISQAMLNLISQQQEDIFMSFAFLAVQTDQGLEKPSELGTSRVMTYSVESRNPPMYITVPVEHIKAKQEVIETKIEQILKKAKLSIAMGDSEQKTPIRSGIAGTVERMELFKALTSLARTLEETEMQIASMVCSYNAGKYIAPEDTGYSVQYNDRFSLEPTAELVELTEKVSTIYRAISPEYVKYQLKKLPHRDLRVGDKTREAIDAEIDNSDIGEMDLIPEPKIPEAKKDQEEDNGQDH